MVGGLAVLLPVLVSRTAGSGLGGTSCEICQSLYQCFEIILCDRPVEIGGDTDKHFNQ